MKKKLSIYEQIQYMKDKGIVFSLCPDKEASEFLKNSNYFFKIKSFAKNFKKINEKYQDLDFAYLKELALMDTLLRDIILEISLVIEHILKVKLVEHLTNNSKEDGYQVVREYLSNKYNEPSVFKRYNRSRESIDFYTKGLMDKYYKYNFPTWAFIEILTFSELLKFLNFYYNKYNKTKFQVLNSLLYNVRKLRNVSAHNNCFLNNLESSEEFTPTKRLGVAVKHLNFKNTYSNKKIDSFLRSPVIHDYASVIIAFNLLCNGDMKEKIKQFKTQYSIDRFGKHLDYFKTHAKLNEKLNFIMNLTKKAL